MKILTWVHRVLNHKVGLAQNARKSGVTTAKSSDDIDNQFMLKNNAFPGVLDGWKAGILAIGTFGYDPLKDENEENHDEYLYKEESEKEQLSALENASPRQINDSEVDEDEEEEANPLVYAAYAHDYEGLLEMKMEENCLSIKNEFEFDAMMKNTKKMRTTLAELFSADSEEMQKKQPINKGEIIKEKSNYKHKLSFVKKLVNGDDARPVHKLHRLMRRMLTRKIHPDLGLYYRHNPINPKINVVEKSKTNEYASLLPIQDATI